MMYYSHNLHFLAYAACMRGDFKEASGKLLGKMKVITEHAVF